MSEEELNKLLVDIIRTGYVRIKWPDGSSRVDVVNDLVINIIQTQHDKLDNTFEPATKKEYEKCQLQKALK